MRRNRERLRTDTRLGSFHARARAAAIFLTLALVLVPLRAAEPAAPMELVPVEAATLVERWSDLLPNLSAAALRVPFEELRWLPIRKIPVVLKGEARVSRQHGLSLAYATSIPSIVVIDDHGMLTRRPGGSARDLGSGGPMAEVNAAFLHVLRGDFGALGPDFSLAAGRDGDRWTLVCEPKDPELQRAVRQLTIEGDAQQVRRLFVQRSGSQQIEIRMGPAERLEAFDAEELKRFFR